MHHYRGFKRTCWLPRKTFGKYCFCLPPPIIVVHSQRTGVTISHSVFSSSNTGLYYNSCYKITHHYILISAVIITELTASSTSLRTFKKSQTPTQRQIKLWIRTLQHKDSVMVTDITTGYHALCLSPDVHARTSASKWTHHQTLAQTGCSRTGWTLFWFWLIQASAAAQKLTLRTDLKNPSFSVFTKYCLSCFKRHTSNVWLNCGNHRWAVLP